MYKYLTAHKENPDFVHTEYFDGTYRIEIRLENQPCCCKAAI